jgi:hypothetical protein
MRECYDDSIAPVVAERWADERSKDSAIADRTKEPKAGFRAQVARELFADLPSDEQKAFGERAKKQAAEAKAAYLSTLNSPPPATAEARQKYVEIYAESGALTRKFAAASPICITLWVQYCRVSMDTPAFTQP